MNVQSLSVVVPSPACINNCKFCVTHMHPSEYKNQMNDNLPFFDLYLKDYLKRLDFAQRNGCNTVMLTGNTEPQQNRKFLTYFGLFMMLMKNPFDWVEMQTTGVMLDREYLRFLRNHVGVNIISLSVSSLEDSVNCDYIGCPDNLKFNLEKLSKDIKEYDFGLRMSINLTDAFDEYANRPQELFSRLKSMGTDQVTLRVLYAEGDGPQAQWIGVHGAKQETITKINHHILLNGKLLGRLPYGANKYSLNGMCVVVDDDCMGKNEEKKKSEEDVLKYLILREDCKLYSQWDDKASLIF